MERPQRILITAGPTHERLDDVRYLANRSSGRMGVALAEAAAETGAEVTLLLGPVALEPARTAPGSPPIRSSTSRAPLIWRDCWSATLVIATC